MSSPKKMTAKKPTKNKHSGLDKALLIWLSVTTSLIIFSNVLYIGNYFYSIVALFGITFVITYILLLPVNLLESAIQKFSEKLHQLKPATKILSHSPEANPRILSVIIVYILFFAITLSASVIFVPKLGNEINNFSKDFSKYLTKASVYASDWSQNTFGLTIPAEVIQAEVIQSAQETASEATNPEKIDIQSLQETPPTTQITEPIAQPEVVKKTLGSASTLLGNSLSEGIDHLFSLATGTLNGFIYFLSGALLVFYFLLDGIRIKEDIIALAPDRGKKEISYFFKSFHAVMFSFIKGQVLLGMVTGTYMFIVYSFFGVPYAFFLGVFLAAAELLPVIGTVIGLIPAIIIMLFTIGPVKTLIVWLLSYGFQTIKDNIIAPKIVGEVMGLHPLVVILSLLICAQAAGLVGILLALPLASLINVTLRYFLQKESTLILEESHHA